MYDHGLRGLGCHELKNRDDVKILPKQMGTELGKLEDTGPVQVLNDCISSRSAPSVEGGGTWQEGRNAADVYGEKEHTQ